MVINLNKLKYWFGDIDGIFFDKSKHVLDWDNPMQRRIFVDRGSNVLLVAHCDTVLEPRIWSVDKENNLIHAQGLDDRLGCHIAWELGKELNCDVLITDLEESAASTAQFQAEKKYKWVAEFDRNGGDVVTYGMESEEWIAALEDFWEVGQGTFSDILFLEGDHCAMNLGIGYFKEHVKDSWANLTLAQKQVDLFVEFFEAYEDITFKRDVSRKQWQSHFFYDPNTYGSGYNGPGYDDTPLCDFCYGPAVMVGQLAICEACLSHLYEISSFFEGYEVKPVNQTIPF